MDPHFDGVIFQTHPAELARRMRSPRPPFLVLDVRSADDHARGSIPGAVALRSSDLQALPAGTDAKTEFFVAGRDLNDPEVRRTTLRLKELGALRVVELTGGVYEWQQFGFPLERPGALVRETGIILLVPGSVGFRSLSYVLDRDVLLGIDTAVTMTALLTAIVAGLLFGDFLVPPRRKL